ncbi:DUF1840 domain-containing protein [Vibrio sp. F74]|uniref:DUF1840 domain-containing protein n=1 Tax=Vibrio sp. F74 TaxID=700020 RepID=UPI0035F5FA1F
MLITFNCIAYANVTMFGDVGLQMLKMLGHSGTVPGAILAADIPAALTQLKAAIKIEKTTVTPNEEEDDFSDTPVNLANRAFPLIELFTAANKEKCNVMWDYTDATS